MLIVLVQVNRSVIKFGRDSSMQAQIGSVKQEHLYNVVVAGDGLSGKTNIIKRYVDGMFSTGFWGSGVSSNQLRTACKDLYLLTVD